MNRRITSLITVAAVAAGVLIGAAAPATAVPLSPVAARAVPGDLLPQATNLTIEVANSLMAKGIPTPDTVVIAKLAMPFPAGGSVAISPTNRKALNRLVAGLRKNGSTAVVYGFSSTGFWHANVRADAVSAWLTERGIRVLDSREERQGPSVIWGMPMPERLMRSDEVLVLGLSESQTINRSTPRAVQPGGPTAGGGVGSVGGTLTDDAGIKPDAPEEPAVTTYEDGHVAPTFRMPAAAVAAFPDDAMLQRNPAVVLGRVLVRFAPGSTVPRAGSIDALLRLKANPAFRQAHVAVLGFDRPAMYNYEGGQLALGRAENVERILEDDYDTSIATPTSATLDEVWGPGDVPGNNGRVVVVLVWQVELPAPPTFPTSPAGASTSGQGDRA